MLNLPKYFKAKQLCGLKPLPLYCNAVMVLVHFSRTNIPSNIVNMYDPSHGRVSALQNIDDKSYSVLIQYYISHV